MRIDIEEYEEMMRTVYAEVTKPYLEENMEGSKFDVEDVELELEYHQVSLIHDALLHYQQSVMEKGDFVTASEVQKVIDELVGADNEHSERLSEEVKKEREAVRQVENLMDNGIESSILQDNMDLDDGDEWSPTAFD